LQSRFWDSFSRRSDSPATDRESLLRQGGFKFLKEFALKRCLQAINNNIARQFANIPGSGGDASRAFQNLARSFVR
jgi:hypothetical protein